MELRTQSTKADDLRATANEAITLLMQDKYDQAFKLVMGSIANDDQKKTFIKKYFPDWCHDCLEYYF